MARAGNGQGETRVWAEKHCLTVVQSLPEGDIRLYPNPAHGQVTVQVGDGIMVDRISIYDLTGKQLLSTPYPPGGKISLEGFKPGIYLLRVHTPQRTVTFKLSVY